MSSSPSERTWQATFSTMLAEIERRLRRSFRRLDPASREEAIAEAVALCVVAFVRLHERGRMHVATPSTLAFYSARQVRRGRQAASRMNSNEPLSRYAQVGNQIEVEHRSWIEGIIDNTRWTVADQVAIRLDARQWFRTLSRRLRRIAKDLAYGFSTSEVAKRHQLSPSRISQLRRELHDAWRRFQQEPALAAHC